MYGVNMKNYNIALLKGDGIGPEIVDSAVRVLEVVGKKRGVGFTFTPYLIGGVARGSQLGLALKEGDYIGIRPLIWIEY